MTEREIILKFPDGTEKRVVGEGYVAVDKETPNFIWAAHGLKFRFPAPDGKTWEFTMSKADALELKKWLNENLEG